jgi:hypothetical protein
LCQVLVKRGYCVESMYLVVLSGISAGQEDWLESTQGD